MELEEPKEALPNYCCWRIYIGGEGEARRKASKFLSTWSDPSRATNASTQRRCVEALVTRERRGHVDNVSPYVLASPTQPTPCLLQRNLVVLFDGSASVSFDTSIECLQSHFLSIASSIEAAR